MELARKAVVLIRADGYFWNTLGVAAFRLRDWATATDSFHRSNRISGGTGIDCFFLAMTCWHKGKRDEARQWFNQATEWIKRTPRSDEPELRRFHVEAAALLGLPGPGPQPGTGGSPKVEASTETARQKDTEPVGSEHAHRSDRSTEPPDRGGRARRDHVGGSLAARGRNDSTSGEDQSHDSESMDERE